ncbi:SepM family pheromone-processing serine protease [Schleiferilactobacillus perolens]|jgi:PDZ domain-containing protein|uniref:Lipoprotein n=1 Tax=Schleiferilactobacillus perolens DSM 12744 TaxID=1423792 RepID=A0A0R1N1Y3_9LACO|nr:SepM family pheromone-processing serine protease [Schleiferilactobacillus perolens]KRL14177.1 lipoprotein precursor [Schleiferilactobacillus perolens DSM 12744]MCI1892280.1 PDZ domain-containing protein [Schleiferilactobacillus harbinensis]MCI1913194.1 PDZ domain-containing protein [Schleiferilactobacillus harbinensis]MCI2171262.1 PDZ domain-containing protein [Schleiferilactobacillus perolens]
MADKQTPQKRGLRWWHVVAGLLVLLALAAAYVPLPNWFIEMPGTAEPLAQFVKVDGKRDTAKGSFNLTTVGIQSATALTLVTSHFKPYEEIISRNDLMGTEDNSTYQKVQNYYMTSAINNALTVSFKAAKKPYHTDYLGIYVLDVEKKSPFYGKLQVGDTITKIDGHHFDASTGYINYLRNHKVGDTVTITYANDQTTKTASGKLYQLAQTKKPGIGITLTDRTKTTTGIPVTANAGDIGGPSAGLMFSLQIYDQLTGNQLRKGRKIAGTGEIAADGTVGQIGGPEKKVYIAAKSGATIFFAPHMKITKAIKKAAPGLEDNYAVAKRAAKASHLKITVVPVEKFSDAVKYLETH